MAVGYTHSFGAGSADVFLVKTDASGNLQWAKAYGGGSYESGTHILSTNDGAYLIGGDTRIFGGANQPDFLAMKIDAAGNVLWANAIGGSDLDHVYSALQLSWENLCWLE